MSLTDEVGKTVWNFGSKAIPFGNQALLGEPLTQTRFYHVAPRPLTCKHASARGMLALQTIADSVLEIMDAKREL